MTFKCGWTLLVAGAAIAALSMAACQKNESVDNAAADAFNSGAPSIEARASAANDNTPSTNTAVAANSIPSSVGR